MTTHYTLRNEQGEKIELDVDWSYFEGKRPNQTITCPCGHEFRAHCKYTKEAGLFSKDPCPACGSHTMRAARGDPEVWSIGG